MTRFRIRERLGRALAEWMFGSSQADPPVEEPKVVQRVVDVPAGEPFLDASAASLVGAMPRSNAGSVVHVFCPRCGNLLRLKNGSSTCTVLCGYYAHG